MNHFLRSLTPDQQISLLFVAVFGVLAVASGVVLNTTEPSSAASIECRRSVSKIKSSGLRIW